MNLKVYISLNMKGNYLSSHVLTEPFQNFSFLNYILLNL